MRTKSQNYRLVLQLFLSSALKSRIKMQLHRCRQAMLQQHLSVQQFIAYKGAVYIRGLTVVNTLSCIHNGTFPFRRVIFCFIFPDIRNNYIGNIYVLYKLFSQQSMCERRIVLCSLARSHALGCDAWLQFYAFTSVMFWPAPAFDLCCVKLRHVEAHLCFVFFLFPVYLKSFFIHSLIILCIP